jgi:RNA ligase (TIGR02306 family)
MENPNSVAFIGRIIEISNIPNADKIVLAKINGWNSIVSKDQHKVGDLVLCITQDAVIPEELAIKWGVDRYLRSGNRVRTIKLKGVYSECILIDMNSLPRLYNNLVAIPKEGDDFMSKLNIFKYEPPVKQIQLASGRKIKYHENPNFHIYWKFPNIKNVSGMFTTEDEVVVTRKIHGTNARYGIVKKKKLSIWDRIKSFFSRDPWINYEWIVGSHNVEKGSESQGFYDTNVWYDIANKMNLGDRLWMLIKNYYHPELIGEGFILYGEIYGPGIQKHYSYNEEEIKFKAFDIKFNNEYVEDSEFRSICKDGLDIETVDYLYEGKYSDELLTKWNNDLIEGTKVIHEGVVIKCITGDRKKIAKVVSPEYLIFNEANNGTDSH